MAVFMIFCPATRHRVSTGIHIRGSTWNSKAKFHAYTHCLACGSVHRWSAEDVALCKDTDVSLPNVVDFIPTVSRRSALAGRGYDLRPASSTTLNQRASLLDEERSGVP
jgi:hypothetical protein